MDDLHWPDEDVAWQGVFGAELAWSVPHGVHVFVFNDVGALQRACEDPRAGGHSITYDEPDEAGVGALIMLARPVTLAVIIHEVTHVALFWSRPTVTPGQRARAFLNSHGEDIPELIGNLSAVLWYSLPKEHLDGALEGTLS